MANDGSDPEVGRISRLDGRIALVTGSTSGIGLGIAHALAQAGAGVMMNGLGGERDNAAQIRAVAAHGTRVAFDTGANYSVDGGRTAQ